MPEKNHTHEPRRQYSLLGIRRTQSEPLEEQVSQFSGFPPVKDGMTFGGSKLSAPHNP